MSGHHGIAYEDACRIVLDRSGGKVDERTPLEALVLPERSVCGHDGSNRALSKEWVGTNLENNGKQLKRMELKVKKAGGEWVCVGCGLCPMPISLEKKK